MGYQKRTSYSSSKRTQKKNNYKPYNQSKKSDKKNENKSNGTNIKKKSNSFKNKSDSTKRGSFSKTTIKNHKTCKPVEKKIFKKPTEPNKLVIQVSTTDAVELTPALWIAFKVNLTKYRKRLDEESALKITKFIQKNAGLFITNMDNEIHVEKLFSVDEVKQYIIKNWTYKHYKFDENNKSKNRLNRIHYSVVNESSSKEPVYYINFNITEFFKDHLEYKIQNNSEDITRSMIVKTSMFVDSDNAHFRSEWVSSIDLEEHKTISSNLNSNDLYILFWNDKDLIDLYKTNPYSFIAKLCNCGSFKVKRITPESNMRYHKKMIKKEEK